jgi:hypothetical protein
MTWNFVAFTEDKHLGQKAKESEILHKWCRLQSPQKPSHSTFYFGIVLLNTNLTLNVYLPLFLYNKYNSDSYVVVFIMHYFSRPQIWFQWYIFSSFCKLHVHTSDKVIDKFEQCFSKISSIVSIVMLSWFVDNIHTMYTIIESVLKSDVLIEEEDVQ